MIKFKLIFILIVIPFFNGSVTFSQNEKAIDSINMILTNPKIHDTVKVMSYLELSYFYYLNNPDTVLGFCLDAKFLAEKNNYTKGRAESYSWLGYLYKHKGDIETSLNYNYKTVKLSREIGDKKGEATVLNNIAVILFEQKFTKKAVQTHLQAIELQKEIGDIEGVALTYNNIGYVYFREHEVEKAIKYYNMALELYEQNNFKIGMATVLNNLGLIYRDQNEFEKALLYFEKAYIIEVELNNIIGVSTILTNIGNVQFKKGDYNQAEKNTSKSLDLAIEIGYPSLIENPAHVLSNIYAAQNKGMKALEMYKLYNVMHDSINNLQVQKTALEQQSKYEYEKQKVIDETHNEKLLAIEKEEKEKQKIITYAIGFGLILVTIFLIFAFNRLRITKKQKRVIELQKDKVQEQKEIIEESHKEITDSINYAKRLQGAILPSIEDVNTHIPNNFILFQPKDVVSGDFYWFEHINNVSYIAVADCTGHGVPGAMVSVVCSNALNRSVKEFGITEPSKILDKTRELVIETFAKSGEEVKDGMDITLCAIDGLKITFSGANNPLWVVKNKSSIDDTQLNIKSTCIYEDLALIEYKADKQHIGLFRDMKFFSQTEIKLNEGDKIYLFSDGFADQFGGDKGKKMKYRPFKKLLLTSNSMSESKQKNHLLSSFEDWKNDLEQVDDVCLIGIKL